MTIPNDVIRWGQRQLGVSDDGQIGPQTVAAIRARGGAPDWPPDRLMTLFLQAEAGMSGTQLDGWWGHVTVHAVNVVRGETSPTWRDERDAGPWPVETRGQRELVEFYGKPGTKDGSFRPPLVQVPVPWTLKISFMPRATRKALWVHEKAADSLKRVLERIDAAYDDAQKTDLGIDVFGGDYAPRIMRGAGRPSLHSWGIAFDFDPDRNALRWGADRARLGQPDAVPFWQAWEAEGWCSLGRARNYDFMHVQAAVRGY